MARALERRGFGLADPPKHRRRTSDDVRGDALPRGDALCVGYRPRRRRLAGDDVLLSPRPGHAAGHDLVRVPELARVEHLQDRVMSSDGIDAI